MQGIKCKVEGQVGKGSSVGDEGKYKREIKYESFLSAIIFLG